MNRRDDANPFDEENAPLSWDELHIVFCIFAAIAPPVVFHRNSLAGILTAVDGFSKHVLVGIFYLVGFALFTLEALLSVWVLQKVYMYFRGRK
ncbi:Secretory carrier-associated membrane protein 5-like protein [Drosera capensis]